MKVRPREAADLAAAQAFLARHNSLRVARLGELVHPLGHPAFAAEAAGGRLPACSPCTRASSGAGRGPR